MTCKQLDEIVKIDPNNLIEILLRYRLHHLAIEICKSYFESVGMGRIVLKRLKAQIYIDWACCKIESNEDSSVLFEIIK